MSGPCGSASIPTIGPFCCEAHAGTACRVPNLRLFCGGYDGAGWWIGSTPNDWTCAAGSAVCCAGADACPVARDEFFVALPPNHRLANQASISGRLWRRNGFLLLEDGIVCASRLWRSAACWRGKRARRKIYAATSLHTLVQMVAGGLA